MLTTPRVRSTPNQLCPTASPLHGPVEGKTRDRTAVRSPSNAWRNRQICAVPRDLGLSSTERGLVRSAMLRSSTSPVTPNLRIVWIVAL